MDDLRSDVYLDNELKESVNELIKEKFVENTDNELTLTILGRNQLKVVFTGGAYDLLHAGHLVTLEEAKSYGNLLVVVIARDSTVSNNKRRPINNENDRLKMIESLKLVDLAVLGDPHDFFKIVRKVRPDVIALGADQKHQESSINKKLIQNGLDHTTLIRLNSDYEGLSTTKIIDKIIKRTET
jgi:FAD synthetase